MLLAVALVNQDETMPTPGANQPTQLPKLDHEAFRSVLSTAPMVMASGTRAGVVLHASWATPAKLPLPAAIAVEMPSAIIRPTASSTELFAAPPSDRLATAGARLVTGGSWWSAMTQSIPAITPLQLPEPSQPRTRTATRRTPLATPYVAPPTVPAT